MANFCQQWHLIVSTILHGFAGYSVYFYQTLLSPIELYVKDLANHSIIAHYGVESSEQTLEWVWAVTSGTVNILGLFFSTSVKGVRLYF